jgi:hypothetical protein
MTEDQLLETVLDLAATCGWMRAHFRPAQTGRGWRTPVSGDGAGFPDLILVPPQPGRVLWRELKSNTGRLRPQQEAWGNRLLAVGEDWAVWRPADWDSRIVPTLTFGRARP